MTNSKIYWWLLILFMENGWRWCCYCCWKEERTALLQLKTNINYTGGGYFSSWVANKTSDCCQWEGIVCSNTTRRVTELSITLKIISEDTISILKNWHFNASLFIPFKNLKALLLPGHSLAGWAQNEELNISRTMLKKLDIRNNGFRSFIPNEELGALRNIECLLLDGNTLDENFLRSSGAMSSLKVLSVADCNLNGALPLQALARLIFSPSII